MAHLARHTPDRSVTHPTALVATSEVLGGRGLVETGGARLGQHGTRSVVQEQKVRREQM